jgi:hypothetical protein
MKPPKRLRNPPKKGFQQKISTSKRQKTTTKRNGQTTAVPHGLEESFPAVVVFDEQLTLTDHILKALIG